MTTNLNAIAGPSKITNFNVNMDEASPTPTELRELSTALSDVNGGRGNVARVGLSVGEDGEVTKVPAFLNKLFR
jgi:heat shock transcription factor